MVFHRNLTGSKSPQVSWTLLSIQTNLSPFRNPLGIVQSVLKTIRIPVTFLFYNVFGSLARSGYFPPFRFLKILLCDLPERQSSQFGRFSFLLTITWAGCLAKTGDPFVSQNPRKVSASHFPGWIPGYAYTTCSYSQILTSCTIPGGSSFPPSRVYSFTLFVLIHCNRLCDWSFRLYHHKTNIYYFAVSCWFLL